MPWVEGNVDGDPKPHLICNLLQIVTEMSQNIGIIGIQNVYIVYFFTDQQFRARWNHPVNRQIKWIPRKLKQNLEGFFHTYGIRI